MGTGQRGRTCPRAAFERASGRGNRWAAPAEIRWPVRVGVLVVVGAALGLASVGYVATVAAGVAAGKMLVEGCWARREGRLDSRGTR